MKDRPSPERTPLSRSACGPGSDCCRPAVQRAYAELRDRGQPERYAFEAALTVYHYYHPETPSAEAQTIVSEWVWDGPRH
ncbi:hypothetical protein [Arenibaculum pallidiluteum]|uniref:hypothetical protein n=1 Tax=Arenibaculum pallidiluteum TaxID=2812559 RepID=UPI002E2E79D9|nr:hypothetical protein [Arenibaculum pallidiluteum]